MNDDTVHSPEDLDRVKPLRPLRKVEFQWSRILRRGGYTLVERDGSGAPYRASYVPWNSGASGVPQQRFEDLVFSNETVEVLEPVMLRLIGDDGSLGADIPLQRLRVDGSLLALNEGGALIRPQDKARPTWPASLAASVGFELRLYLAGGGALPPWEFRLEQQEIALYYIESAELIAHGAGAAIQLSGVVGLRRRDDETALTLHF